MFLIFKEAFYNYNLAHVCKISCIQRNLIKNSNVSVQQISSDWRKYHMLMFSAFSGQFLDPLMHNLGAHRIYCSFSTLCTQLQVNASHRTLLLYSGWLSSAQNILLQLSIFCKILLQLSILARLHRLVLNITLHQTNLEFCFSKSSQSDS